MSLLTATGIGLLGFTGATQVLAARREARAAKLSPPRGQDVEVAGRRVHVEVLGAAGPDLVLIHGSSGNTRDFTFRLAGELAARYRVFVVDRPGLGWSDALPQGDGLEAQARAIQAAVAALGAERPIVLGQSYGGAVALAWAAALPGTLAGVVSVSGVAYPWETGLGLYYTILSHPLGRALLIPLITAWVPRAAIKREIDKVFAPQTAPAGYDEHFGPELTVRRGAMRVNALQRRALHGEISSLSPRWAEIGLPIEIVHGDADMIVHHSIHADRLAAENPQARLTLLPGIGHMPHHVARPEVIAAIDRAALRANVK
ncbi:alpha/beta fold hydrolase [Sinisalibacter aestuarii]|uniref:Hydrolase or acyltransferase n=1 Tax=Sinisalibacter aestuarii TaxID=2949426 RepID=A0ABQ5LRM4_9RHOB|nr:alpha/beta hydrolase [Sinisalibacter aestuarii]GKY87649.1 hydrolase or acyltransferase [Sinisalibacter aestuarii]